MDLKKYEFPNGRIIIRIKGQYIELTREERMELEVLLSEE